MPVVECYSAVYHLELDKVRATVADDSYRDVGHDCLDLEKEKSSKDERLKFATRMVYIKGKTGKTRIILAGHTGDKKLLQ